MAEFLTTKFSLVLLLVDFGAKKLSSADILDILIQMSEELNRWITEQIAGYFGLSLLLLVKWRRL